MRECLSPRPAPAGLFSVLQPLQHRLPCRIHVAASYYQPFKAVEIAWLDVAGLAQSVLHGVDPPISRDPHPLRPDYANHGLPARIDVDVLHGHLLLAFAAVKWPPIVNGMMRLSPAQLAALLEGLDWSRVHVPRVMRPKAVQ
jgi:hypothetical protein